MKLLCLVSSFLAVASAFSPQGPRAFVTKISTPQGEQVADSAAHRTRRATIVMDGKANGTYVHFVPVRDFLMGEHTYARRQPSRTIILDLCVVQ